MVKEQKKYNNLGCMLKPVSDSCNLHCRYCYYHSYYQRSGRRLMSREVLEAFTRQYIRISYVVPNFAWQGGEPTLAGISFFEEAVAMQKKLQPPNIRVTNSIQTNGVGLNDEWARFFKKNGFLVGISIDGPAEVNDAYRVCWNNSSIFKPALKGGRTLREYNVDVNVLTVITQANVQKAREVYQFLRSEKVDYMQFIPCTETAPLTNNFEKITISGVEFGRFLCDIFTEWIKEDDPGVYIRIIDNLFHTFFGLEPESCEFKNQCENLITLEYNGNIYPCDFFVRSEWRLGNILEDSLEEVLKGQKFKEFLSETKKIPERCKDCEWFFTCKGGCLRHRLSSEGIRNNILCESYQMFFKYAFSILEEILNGRYVSSDKIFRLLKHYDNIYGYKRRESRVIV